MNKNSQAIEKETKNLKYMWNRHSETFLGVYLERSDNQAQPPVVKELILNYLLTHSNKSSIPIIKKSVRSVETAFYIKFFRRIRTNWLTKTAKKLPFFVTRSLINIEKARSDAKAPKGQFDKFSFLDIASGSGTYYRYFVKSGLTPFLNYTGIDIAEKNINNAKKLYPGVDFRVGNILGMEFPDNSFDIVFVSHLYEHLSPDVLEKAFSETLRVAKDLIIINFFYEQEMKDHIITKHEKYHWNGLSRQKILKLIGLKPSQITIIDKYRGIPRAFINKQGFPSIQSTWVISKKPQKSKKATS